MPRTANARLAALAADASAERELLHPLGEDEPRKDRQFVTALARGLELLRAFTPQAPLLGNQELAQLTGLPKPTVSRLTHTLTRLGYLTRSERLGKYALNTGVLSLGFTALSSMGVREVARPLMQELAEYANVPVSLGQRDRLNMVYVEHCRSAASVTLRLDLGSRLPLATTAMGRALLAAIPERERSYLMDHLARRDRTAWPQLRKSIEQALRDYEERGFTLSVGDWDRDVVAVGVPLIPPDGSGIVAFNCGGPAFSLTRERLEGELGPRLVNLARVVQARLVRR
ncbi:IclR family transcriptional regulator [Aggregicoccus sp. 17bor-14]|uniref:IclR family transcriptional regulator n=1 Tax=Myxococcaceae TaxID=31 RepID=UPI00129D10FE|nr:MULTISPECIES: IclR family transcriptional regulator [Myxococcaceae]MBF5042009.1 IclR family transcriptional regulator [Simulacricoccus sp. 17bor-14]MRI87789.1 IclR family transcriptional regulator [Aggregicoccus sp. 17bor-14]